jgi:hypothetical protein
LDGSIVLIVDGNPWDPFVRWLQGIGLVGDGVLHVDAILTLVAGHDVRDVGDLMIGGALVGNALIIYAGIVGLDAVHEVELLEWALD